MKTWLTHDLVKSVCCLRLAHNLKTRQLQLTWFTDCNHTDYLQRQWQFNSMLKGDALTQQESTSQNKSKNRKLRQTICCCFLKNNSRGRYAAVWKSYHKINNIYWMVINHFILSFQFVHCSLRYCITILPQKGVIKTNDSSQVTEIAPFEWLKLIQIQR